MTFRTALRRVRWRLSYVNQERELAYYGLDGADMPCSYAGLVDDDGEIHADHSASAEWNGGEAPLDTAPENEWIRFWFKCAVEESIHEALEHFLVDGKALLDPHGTHELMLYEILNGVSEELWELVARKYPIHAPEEPELLSFLERRSSVVTSTT